MSSANPGAFSKAQPFIVGIGVPVAIVLLGIVLPIVYSQGQSIQKLVDQVEEMRGSVDKFQTTADRLDKHMTETETDPSRVLAQILGTTAVNRKIGASVVIDGNIFVFPKDAAAESDLVRAGYKETEITPTVSGYKATIEKILTGSDAQHSGR